MDPIDFNSIFFLLCKLLESINCLVTDNLQHEKEIHTGLKQL